MSKGKHTIKLTKDDFGDKEKEFEINKNETISFELYEKGKETSKSGMVKIPGKNFKMDVTEVTVAQFKECVRDGRCSQEKFKSSYNNYSQKENHPMTAVNWYGAYEYCKWVGKRLPTEEEWKYAAKGGEDYIYAGSNNPDEVAWYDKNEGTSTHEVATKKANGYGLYDMSGNVWEWTNSWSTDNQKYRVLNGGSSNSRAFGNENFISVYSRYVDIPSRFNDYYGFRCVQDLE